MKKELIVSTNGTLGGSPRLDGRRLDIAHVIYGITEQDYEYIEAYQNDFDVSINQIRHAIMYCKDEVCELMNVSQSCQYCSKNFRKDIEALEEITNEIEKLKRNNGITNSKESLKLIEELEEGKLDYEGDNVWEITKNAYQKLQEELDLPNSYQELTME